MKVFQIEMIALNGTVTMMHETSLFATKELAQETLESLKEYNKHHNDFEMHLIYVGPKEVEIYEKKADIPFFKDSYSK